jgi:hypothetical protein
MQLYEKIMIGKRTTYKEFTPVAPAAPDVLEDKEIDAEEVVTILSGMVISMLMSVSEQLLPHMKVSKETKLLEQAVVRYASNAGAKVRPELVDVGVKSWNAAVKAMQEGLLTARGAA